MCARERVDVCRGECGCVQGRVWMCAGKSVDVCREECGCVPGRE